MLAEAHGRLNVPGQNAKVPLNIVIKLLNETPDTQILAMLSNVKDTRRLRA